MYADIARIYARNENDAYANGAEYGQAWIAGQMSILDYADKVAVAVMPTIALAFDSLDSKFGAGWTVDDVMGMADAGTRNMTILSFMDDATAVLEGIAKQTMDLGYFVDWLDIDGLYNHVVRYMNARINASVPTVAETLAGRGTPAWAVPLMVAVDGCARFPTMNSATDPNNASRRLWNLNADGSYWKGFKRDRMADCVGYANVIASDARTSRITASANTTLAESARWPTVGYKGTIYDWVSQTA